MTFVFALNVCSKPNRQTFLSLAQTATSIYFAKFSQWNLRRKKNKTKKLSANRLAGEKGREKKQEIQVISINHISK